MQDIKSKNEIQKSSNIKWGIAYIFWILGAWTIVGIYRFVFYTNITYLSNETSTLYKELIRFFVFIGPIIAFIIHHAKKSWYRWLGLYGCKKNTLYKTIMISIIYTAIGTCINILIFHKHITMLSLSPTFLLTTFSTSIIIEEIAFRGFLFYLFEKWNKYTVIIVTSLVFAIKHLPGWLLFPSELSALGLIGDFLMVFSVGCILGYLYLATHSIWATAIIHSINNLIVALFS